VAQASLALAVEEEDKERMINEMLSRFGGQDLLRVDVKGENGDADSFVATASLDLSSLEDLELPCRVVEGSGIGAEEEEARRMAFHHLRANLDGDTVDLIQEAMRKRLLHQSTEAGRAINRQIRSALEHDGVDGALRILQNFNTMHRFAISEVAIACIRESNVRGLANLINLLPSLPGYLPITTWSRWLEVAIYSRSSSYPSARHDHRGQRLEGIAETLVDGVLGDGRWIDIFGEMQVSCSEAAQYLRNHVMNLMEKECARKNRGLKMRPRGLRVKFTFVERVASFGQPLRLSLRMPKDHPRRALLRALDMNHVRVRMSRRKAGESNYVALQRARRLGEWHDGGIDDVDLESGIVQIQTDSESVSFTPGELVEVDIFEATIAPFRRSLYTLVDMVKTCSNVPLARAIFKGHNSPGDHVFIEEEGKSHIEPFFSESQRRAIVGASKPGLTVVRGYAGTGKTSCATEVVAEWLRQSPMHDHGKERKFSLRCGSERQVKGFPDEKERMDMYGQLRVPKIVVTAATKSGLRKIHHDLLRKGIRAVRIDIEEEDDQYSSEYTFEAQVKAHLEAHVPISGISSVHNTHNLERVAEERRLAGDRVLALAEVLCVPMDAVNGYALERDESDISTDYLDKLKPNSRHRIRAGGQVRAVLDLINISCLLVDEADLIDEVDFFSLMRRQEDLKRVALFGDAPMRFEDQKRESHIFRKIYERRLGACFDLTEQFRVESAVCLYPSSIFRGAQVPQRLLSEEKTSQKLLFRHGVLLVPYEDGEEQKSNWYVEDYKNPKEAEKVCEVLQNVVEKCHPRRITVAVLTPYESQAAVLADIVERQQENTTVTVSTLDNFRGNEADVVIISSTRDNDKGYLDLFGSPAALELALTRARLGVAIVGSIRTLKRQPYWRSWFDVVDEVMKTHHVKDMESVFNASNEQMLLKHGESSLNLQQTVEVDSEDELTERIARYVSQSQSGVSCIDSIMDLVHELEQKELNMNPKLKPLGWKHLEKVAPTTNVDDALVREALADTFYDERKDDSF